VTGDLDLGGTCRPLASWWTSGMPEAIHGGAQYGRRPRWKISIFGRSQDTIDYFGALFAVISSLLALASKIFVI